MVYYPKNTPAASDKQFFVFQEEDEFSTFGIQAMFFLQFEF